MQLPANRWVRRYSDPSLEVYFLPTVGSNQYSSAVLTVYRYYEDSVREVLGLTWPEFIHANLSAIADKVPNYQLLRQWEVKRKPLNPRLLNPAPEVWDQRAEFRYGGVDKITAVDGFGLNKRIGPIYYFVRLDVCAYNRETDREEVVKKIFDSLALAGYGGYW